MIGNEQMLIKLYRMHLSILEQTQAAMDNTIELQFYSHFTRYFTPHRMEDIPQLCELLGLRVFQMTSELSLNFLDDETIRRILLGIRECTLQQLFINNIGCPRICSYLSGVTFTNLQCLSLEMNNIISIEPLAHVGCHNIKTLLVGYNHFVTVKSLRKVNLNSLELLSLCNDQGRQLRVDDAFPACNAYYLFKIDVNGLDQRLAPFEALKMTPCPLYLGCKLGYTQQYGGVAAKDLVSTIFYEYDVMD